MTAYVCVGVGPVPVVPSPKFQAYDTMSFPSSVEPEPSKAIGDPSMTVYGPPALATGTELNAAMLTHHPLAIDPESKEKPTQMWGRRVPVRRGPAKIESVAAE